MVSYKSFTHLNLAKLQAFDSFLRSVYSLELPREVYTDVRIALTDCVDHIVIEKEERTMHNAIGNLYAQRPLSMEQYRVLYETIFFEIDDDWFSVPANYAAFDLFRYNLSKIMANRQ